MKPETISVIATIGHSLTGLLAFYYVCMAVLKVHTPENKRLRQQFYEERTDLR